jgi:hypothetical protein
MGDNVDKTGIMGQIADLSRLLGMIPDDATVVIKNPVTDETMELSDWFAETRDSFLRLSLLVGRALDLPFQ